MLSAKLPMLKVYLDDQGEHPVIELKVSWLREFLLEVNQLKSYADSADAVADNYRGRILVAQAVLMGLKHGDCWCQMALSNPMVHEHSQWCKLAQAIFDDTIDENLLVHSLPPFDQEGVRRLSIPGNLCTQCDAVMGEPLACPGCGWIDPLTKGKHP